MADSDKNIVIYPQRGSSTSSPEIVFTGKGNDPIKLRVPDANTGSLSFEGSAGQLFSVTNNLTSGSIFSVNDVSGIPSLDIDASGLIKLAPFGGTISLGGNVGIGSVTPEFKLTVFGGQTRLAARDKTSTGDTLTLSTTEESNRMELLFSHAATNYYRIQSVHQGVDYTALALQNDGGNVGIGTTNPAAKLHVYGNQFLYGGNYFAANTSGYFFAGNNSYAGGIFAGNSGNLVTIRSPQTTVFENNSAPTFTINSNGYTIVGDRNRVANNTQILEIAGCYTGSNGNYAGLYFRNSQDSGGGSSSIRAGRFGDNYGTDLSFWTQVYGGAGTGDGLERVRISSTGNVGIGTTVPSSEFHIYGNNPVLTIEGNASSYTEGAILLKNSGSSGFRGNGIYMLDAGASREWYSGTPYGNNDNYIIARVGSGITTPATETAQFINSLFTIASTGNVGIGTTNPDSNLHIYNISGNAKLTIETNETYDSYINFSGATSEASIGYEPTSNSLIFSNAADGLTTAERLRITSTGNVGIGTTNPITTLDLRSSSIEAMYIRRSDEPNGYGFLGISGSNTFRIGSYVAGSGWGNIILNDGGGNVGIGTINPAFKLDIQNNVADLLRLYNTNSSVKGTYITLNDTTYAAKIGHYEGDVQVWSGSIAGDPDVTIKTGGNVGIGTTNPAAKLTVYNVVDASAYFKSTASGAEISLDAVNGYAALKILDNGTEKWRVGQVGQTSDFEIWQTGIGDRLRITSAGNVGIGITNPQVKLSVSGETSVGQGRKLTFIGLDINSQVIPTYIKIKTTIPAASTAADFTVTIKGFRYGNAENLNIDVSWHWYTDTFYNTSVTSYGSWAPTVKLSNEAGLVCITLYSPSYWPKLYVESMYSSAYADAYATGWTWADEDAAGINITTLAYKADFGNQFVMTSSGNVGVGSASPGYKLDVIGDTKASRITTVASNNSFVNSFTGCFDIGLRVLHGIVPKLDLWHDGSSVGQFRFSTYKLIYGTHNGNDVTTDRFAIDASGNVGIGTTNPQSRLAVNGYITESTDNATTYWNVVTQQDVGTAPNQLPLNQYLGQLAFLDDVAPNSLRREGGSIDDVYVNSSGNVGIGTTNLSNKLHVYGANPVTIFESNNTYLDINLRNTVSSVGYIQYINTDLRFFAGSPSIPGLTITGGAPGYVGIGTTTPQKILEVITPASNYASVGVAALAEGEWTGIHFGYRENNTAYRKSVIAFERRDGAARGKIHILNNNDYNSNSVQTISADARLTIQSDGNIGIGTTNPFTKLDTRGALHVGGGSDGIWLGNVGDNSAYDNVKLYYTGYNSGSPRIYLTPRTQPGSGFLTTYLHLQSATGVGANNMGLLVDGNVGIGTTGPLQKLDVRGNFLLTTDANTSTHITQKPYTINNGTLSWEGSAGQLFSITNNLTSGSIFSVNDVSGLPSIDVDADGTIELAPYGGSVGIGTTNPTNKLDVNSDSIRVRTTKTPASATATGNAGEICWDANYVYVCVATNTWKRSALSTW